MPKPLRPSNSPRHTHADTAPTSKKKPRADRASNAAADIAQKRRMENPALWLTQASPDYACKVIDTAHNISMGDGNDDMTKSARRMLQCVFDLYGAPDDSRD